MRGLEFQKRESLLEYLIHGKSLKSVSSSKHFGVAVSQDLSWTKYIDQITTKANNTLKFIKINNSLKEVFRPIAES